MRVREDVGGTSRFFLGDAFTVSHLASGDTEYRTEVFAFGERVAFFTSVVEEAQARLPLVGISPPPPALVLWIPASALLLAVLSIRGRRKVLVLVAARPGTASLALVLITCLVIPFPVDAGGGEPNTVYRWVLSDQIGSGIAVLDEDGYLVRHTRFKPFGGLDDETGGSAGDRRFYAGHPQQEETGLSYMKARWMSPETGTFLSVDPLINPSDPQSHTGYSYARNNPVNLTDPTGEDPLMEQVGAGSAAATSALMGMSSWSAVAVVTAAAPAEWICGTMLIGTGLGGGGGGRGDSGLDGLAGFAKGLVDFIVGSDSGKSSQSGQAGETSPAQQSGQPGTGPTDEAVLRPFDPATPFDVPINAEPTRADFVLMNESTARSDLDVRIVEPFQTNATRATTRTGTIVLQPGQTVNFTTHVQTHLPSLSGSRFGPAGLPIVPQGNTATIFFRNTTLPSQGAVRVIRGSGL